MMIIAAVANKMGSISAKALFQILEPILCCDLDLVNRPNGRLSPSVEAIQHHSYPRLDRHLWRPAQAALDLRDVGAGDIRLAGSAGPDSQIRPPPQSRYPFMPRSASAASTDGAADGLTDTRQIASPGTSGPASRTAFQTARAAAHLTIMSMP